MLRFLVIAGEGVGQEPRPVPSVAVDAAWHAFILHTRDYIDYCERHYGRYLHHVPDPPEPDDADAAAQRSSQMDSAYAYLLTRVRMKRRFGELDETVWPVTTG